MPVLAEKHCLRFDAPLWGEVVFLQLKVCKQSHMSAPPTHTHHSSHTFYLSRFLAPEPKQQLQEQVQLIDLHLIDSLDMKMLLFSVGPCSVIHVS